MDNWINIIPVLVIALACIFIMIADDWRKKVLAIALIYISAFLIILQFWSFLFSFSKFLTAIMSLVVLTISIINARQGYHSATRGEKIFRASALALAFLVVFAISSKASSFLSIPLEIVLSSLFILVCGILQLGMTQIPFAVFLSLLLIFFGFELIYSANETSLLVNGMLAFVSLLVSLVGAYIISNEYDGEAT